MLYTLNFFQKEKGGQKKKKTIYLPNKLTKITHRRNKLTLSQSLLEAPITRRSEERQPPLRRQPRSGHRRWNVDQVSYISRGGGLFEELYAVGDGFAVVGIVGVVVMIRRLSR